MQPITILMAFGLALFAHAAPQGTPVADGTAPIPTSQLGPGNPPQCMSVAQQIPTCGLGCMEAAQRSVGCDPVDFKCGCSGNNPAAIRDNAIDCVISACGLMEALQVQGYAEQLCTCAGMNTPDFSTTSTSPVRK